MTPRTHRKARGADCAKRIAINPRSDCLPDATHSALGQQKTVLKSSKAGHDKIRSRHYLRLRHLRPAEADQRAKQNHQHSVGKTSAALLIGEIKGYRLSAFLLQKFCRRAKIAPRREPGGNAWARK
jgi:hypothetical protein